jgi:hypothetical protein
VNFPWRDMAALDCCFDWYFRVAWQYRLCRVIQVTARLGSISLCYCARFTCAFIFA